MSRSEIILGIVFGLLVNEVTDISPWAARKLTRRAAYLWTTDPDTAAAYAEEWTAIIEERPGKLLKLFTALRFTIGATGRAAPRLGYRAFRAFLAASGLLARMVLRRTPPTEHEVHWTISKNEFDDARIVLTKINTKAVPWAESQIDLFMNGEEAEVKSWRLPLRWRSPK
ncbi:hypothetical protein ABZY58_06925 [Micromonospora tulbaghiae]|uniref:hypothetical protein n=1 Tax=Micromonospora tulbaghiae TaxID=479978 RepID=UPI0033A4E6E5